jgi:hypothetical protein
VGYPGGTDGVCNGAYNKKGFLTSLSWMKNKHFSVISLKKL